MVALRTFLVLSALVSPVIGNTHTRGAASLQEEADLQAHLAHQEAARLLKKKKDKKINLTGGNDKKKDDKKKKKNEKGGGGKQRFPDFNTGTNDGYSVAENHACVPFNENMQGRASMSLSDDACRTNSCGGGCCRVYHWLICDEDNSMPQLACVCNENTRPPPTNAPTNPPTPYPTLPLSTPQPTPFPTDSGAITDLKDGEGLVTNPPVPSPTEPPVDPGPTQDSASQSGSNSPPYTGVPSDSCAEGSPHHNNPLFVDFTKCLSADDCPLATECCIHSFCFCGRPDNWDGDCVARAADISK